MFHFSAIFVLSSFSARFKPACENRESPLHLRSDGEEPPGHRPHGGKLTNNIMAIIKGTFGTNLHKRVGQVVYRNRGGVNIASARPASVKNPRTAEQMKQRMIFSTVQAAYKKMRVIVDHSQEGVTYGARTMASFMKLNLMALRKNYETGAFCLKGNSNVVAPFAFKIATGSLTFDQNIVAIENNIVNTGFTFGEKTIATLTYRELLSMLGVSKGDQLTFVVCAGNYNKLVTDLDYVQFSDTYFRPIRVVFSLSAADTTLAFAADGHLNDAICDQTNSDFFYHDLIFSMKLDTKKLNFEDSAFGGYVEGEGWLLYGAAIILSRMVGSVWQRSETNLVVEGIGDQKWMGGADIIESYNPKSNYYLNNATV